MAALGGAVLGPARSTGNAARAERAAEGALRWEAGQGGEEPATGRTKGTTGGAAGAANGRDQAAVGAAGAVAGCAAVPG